MHLNELQIAFTDLSLELRDSCGIWILLRSGEKVDELSSGG